MYLCHHIVPVDFCWSRHDAFVLGTQGVLAQFRAKVPGVKAGRGSSWPPPTWVFPGMGYPNGSLMDNLTEMDDLGVPLFLGNPLFL